LDHLLAAAFLAISLRRLALIAPARAFPPLRPSATAAGSFPSSGGVDSSISPVAIRITRTALPITSAGRFSPLGPRGTGKHPYYFVQVFADRYVIPFQANDATAPIVIWANYPDMIRVDVNALIGGAALGSQGIGKPNELGHQASCFALSIPQELGPRDCPSRANKFKLRHYPIELVPGGFLPMRRTIASMRIANISDLADISDYVLEAMEAANPLTGAPARKGNIVLYHHDRRQSVWALLARAASEIERADFVQL